MVACSVVSASHVCTGKSGALIAKAVKKPRKIQRCVTGSMSRAARSLIRKLGLPASAETTYSPITDASITRPPASW